MCHDYADAHLCQLRVQHWLVLKDKCSIDYVSCERSLQQSLLLASHDNDHDHN